MGIMSIRKVAQKLLAPVIIVLVLALTIGMFYIGLPNWNKDVTSYRGKAVGLDGQVVKGSEFQGYITQAEQQANQFAQYGITMTQAQIRDSALSRAVSELAIKVAMKKVASKIKVTNAEVDQLIKKYLPTDEEVQSFMERQGLSSRKELNKIVRQDLEKQKFFQLKARDLKVKVPKEEVLGQIEEITVSHILIGVKDSQGKILRSDAEALSRAYEVWQKVVAGGDFAALAKEYTDDPGSKENGGQYGPMPLTQFKSSMVKEFVEGALSLKEGGISQPVKTEYGYHLIKLDKRSLPTGAEYKRKYREAEDSLLLTKAQENPEFEAWMNTLTKSAEGRMEILDPGLRAYRLAKEKKWAEAVKAYDKALKNKYYQKQGEMYVGASEAYLSAKAPQKALEILKKAPAANQDEVNYQIALAKVYKEMKQPKKAEQSLVSFGKKHADDLSAHQTLQKIFTEWKMTKAAEEEETVITRLQNEQQQQIQQYQQNLNEKTGAASNSSK